MSYNHKFPVRKTETNVYFQGNHTLKDSIIENMKILVLTRKGEYLMDNDYGVGIHNYLFNNLDDKTKKFIIKDIKEQIQKYIERVIVNDVFVYDKHDIEIGKASQQISRYYKPIDVILDENQVLISISYDIEGQVSTSPNLFAIVVTL